MEDTRLTLLLIYPDPDDMMPQNLLDIFETAEDCIETTEEDDEVDNIIDIVFDEDDWMHHKPAEANTLRLPSWLVPVSSASESADFMALYKLLF